MSQYNPLGSRIPNVPFEQPKSLFRFGEQSIWSSQLIVNGQSAANQNFRLFTTPMGQVGQGYTQQLTITETNLKEGGRVPSGLAYDVFGIAGQVMLMSANGDAAGVDYSEAIDTQAEIDQLLAIIQSGVLRWNFTQTTIDVCPLLLAGAGGGAFGAVAQNAAGANSGHMNNGNGQIWMYRKHPVALPGNTTFSVELVFGNRGPNIATMARDAVARVVLLGYYKNIIEIG
jgi:hypothetical protein